MQSKTLTLRIEDENIIDSIEFIKNLYSIKTDSKAIQHYLKDAQIKHVHFVELNVQISDLQNELFELKGLFAEKQNIDFRIKEILQ